MKPVPGVHYCGVDDDHTLVASLKSSYRLKYCSSSWSGDRELQANNTVAVALKILPDQGV